MPVMRRAILQQTLTLTKVGTQFGDLTFGPKACAQQTEGVKPLQPLRITDVGLASGDVLGIARIDNEYRKATSVEELNDRDPIDAGRRKKPTASGFSNSRLANG
jgi:hypothetical protein